jgi:hypothetical protein
MREKNQIIQSKLTLKSLKLDLIILTYNSIYIYSILELYSLNKNPHKIILIIILSFPFKRLLAELHETGEIEF